MPDPEKVKVEKAAEPLVVALPVYEMSTDGKTYTDKELATVHLYPKNVGTIVEKPVTPTKPKNQVNRRNACHKQVKQNPS